MPFYHKLGSIPPKRHTIFRKDDGSLYHEQLFGTIGFDGMSSLMYHMRPPTVVKEIKGEKNIAPEIGANKNMIMRSFMGYKVLEKNDFLESRVPIKLRMIMFLFAPISGAIFFSPLISFTTVGGLM